MWKLRQIQSSKCKGNCFALLPWPPENALCSSTRDDEQRGERAAKYVFMTDLNVS